MDEAERMDLEIALAECERDLPYTKQQLADAERRVHAMRDRVRQIKGKMKILQAKLGRKNLAEMVEEMANRPVR